ncbi:hypothetical protein [Granulicella mallensis]|uniref:Uncharacterized protein n=1 Tax=Granulicella mallensis TaxID=940614 RepID=A0A7W7ZU00_9BACT|nr:hypothetical protein [Granulicella mallensis]MBB5066098.1 hypothetical protein [Granulicella mallensis]
MYENYVPWESGVPADLRPAVKHLRESFDDAHLYFGSVTKNFCYALLHAGTISEESKEYAEALVKLKARIGPIPSQRFNETVAQGTPSAIFKSHFDFYLEGLSVQVPLIFKALVKIGRANENHLSTPHLEWAESQTKLLIGSYIHLIDIWVRAVCDTDPYDPDEDFDERIHRTKWQAPRFLIMKPSRYEPYDAAKAWERVDAETSMRWRKMFYEHYVLHLELKLRNLAGEAAVELAMQRQPATQPTVERTSQQGSQHASLATASDSTLEQGFGFSPDFRSVRHSDLQHALTLAQSQMMRVLWEAHSSGYPVVGKARLLTAIESETSAVRDTWRKSPLWNTLIVSEKKGAYRLNLPKK